jgi:hypothetical protein
VIRRLLFLIGGLLAGPALSAHPIHASLAEADFNPKTGQLEIALRLFSDDAETALSAQAGKKVRLESTSAAELDRLLLAHVRGAFVVKSKAGAPQTLTWVGRELKDGDQHLWIYFTCPLPGGVAGAVVADRVLRDAFPDQLNSVRIRDQSVTPARQVTLLFANDREQTVVFH